MNPHRTVLSHVRAIVWLLTVAGMVGMFAGPPYDLSWHSIDGGGGESAGGGYIMSAVIGQPDAGTMSGGGYILSGGFFAVATDPECPADTDDNGSVEVIDLLALLAAWGACPTPPAPCPSDIDNNGSVEVIDLLALLAAWGNCP